MFQETLQRCHTLYLHLPDHFRGIEDGGIETGELLDCIKKHTIYQKPLDVENVKEELGDLLFYMSNLMQSVGLSFEEVLQHNVDKLSVRYSSGKYSNQQAQERADKV